MVIRSFAELEAALRGCPSLRPALAAADDPATLAALAYAESSSALPLPVIGGWTNERFRARGSTAIMKTSST